MDIEKLAIEYSCLNNMNLHEFSSLVGRLDTLGRNSTQFISEIHLSIGLAQSQQNNHAYLLANTLFFRIENIIQEINDILTQIEILTNNNNRIVDELGDRDVSHLGLMSLAACCLHASITWLTTYGVYNNLLISLNNIKHTLESTEPANLVYGGLREEIVSHIKHYIGVVSEIHEIRTQLNREGDDIGSREKIKQMMFSMLDGVKANRNELGGILPQAINHYGEILTSLRNHHSQLVEKLVQQKTGHH